MSPIRSLSFNSACSVTCKKNVTYLGAVMTRQMASKSCHVFRSRSYRPKHVLTVLLEYVRIVYSITHTLLKSSNNTIVHVKASLLRLYYNERIN